MKQVMYGIKIVDVNDFGGWIGYGRYDLSGSRTTC